MTPGKLQVHGNVTEEWRGHIERCLHVAMASLELDSITVEVTSSSRVLPKGLVAGAGPGHIWISPKLFDYPLVATATLLEEAAHCKLIEEGVQGGLNSFADALLQEFFASWYTFFELLRIAPYSESLFDDQPLPRQAPTAEYGYALGGLLGASVAGVAVAQRQLDQWKASGVVEPGVKAITDRLERIAVSAESPPQLAAAIGSYYHSRRASLN